MNIQSLLTAGFVLLMVAPLPVILLSSPLGFIWEKLMYVKYYHMVKKHFNKPEYASLDQLKNIFPGKKIKELQYIAYTLQPNNTYKDN